MRRICLDIHQRHIHGYVWRDYGCIAKCLQPGRGNVSKACPPVKISSASWALLDTPDKMETQLRKEEFCVWQLLRGVHTLLAGTSAWSAAKAAEKPLCAAQVRSACGHS